MKQWIILAVGLLTLSVGAQNEMNHQNKIDSLTQIDFLAREYTYLDADFRPKISSEDFDGAVKKYEFYPDKIQDRTDSLSVILRHELQDSDAARIATLQLSYSWERLGYYLWESEKKLKRFAKKKKLYYPYKVKKYVQTQEPKRLLRKLRKKVYEETKEEKVLLMDTKELLKFAFRYSPERRKKVNQIHLENGNEGIRQD